MEPWSLKYPKVAVKCAVYGGPPLAGLLRAANGVRLLVIGDHRRGPATRTLLGTVTHGALDQAAGPVVVVRAHSAGMRPSDGSEFTA